MRRKLLTKLERTLFLIVCGQAMGALLLYLIDLPAACIVVSWVGIFTLGLFVREVAIIKVVE